jgi:hypothetical protein
VSVPLESLRDTFLVDVNTDYMSTLLFRHSMGHCPDATADIENLFACPNSVYKEIMIPRMPVLGVGTPIIVDGFPALNRVECRIQAKKKSQGFVCRKTVHSSANYPLNKFLQIRYRQTGKSSG